MDSPHVDDGSLQAVKSLRSKFEQLAVDTAGASRRPSSSTGDLLGTDSPSPRYRRPSGSHLDLFAPQVPLHTSSSSSDLKVTAKRPPPPPPPPRNSKLLSSPRPSRSPSPLPVTQLRRLGEEPDEDGVLQGVAVLKSKFDSPSSGSSLLGPSSISAMVEFPSKPTLPPRPVRNGEPSQLSTSPDSTEPSSPEVSPPRSATPLQHHRPPPPIPRSRSPRPSIEPESGMPSIKARLSSSLPASSPISRQNTPKGFVKPAIPPRLQKHAEILPPAIILDENVSQSPDSTSLSFDSGGITSSPSIPPAIPSRSPEIDAIESNLGDLVQLQPEGDASQLAPPLKTFRTTMPPPPRHHSTFSPLIGDTNTPSLKPSVQPPARPARRVTSYAEEPASTSPRPTDRVLASISERTSLSLNKLPPPPTRTIGLGDKLPPPRRPPSPESEDESGSEDDPKAQAADSMPDSSTSSRRPPVLGFEDWVNEPRIQMPSHSGVLVTSGSSVVIGHGHHIRIYDLTLTDVPVLSLDTREIGAKEAKVTVMEFRPTMVKADRGALLWIGTKEGHLFELDVRSGYITAAKHIAHPHPIAHLFRHGRSMVSIDEGGKTLVFSPGENGEDISLVSTQPRVIRTAEKHDFVKLLDGKLWTASRTEQQHLQGHQRLPIIRVYDILNPSVAIGRSLIPTEHVGPVTSATILPTQPDFVYLGHEEGFISIWSLRTEDGFPKCIEVTRLATSDILCLEGVNDRLWAGARNGMISALDVSLKPWLVTNCWNAHPGVPVSKLSVNYGAIEKNGKLCVVSVGRDGLVKLWDGLLGVDWIDNELQKAEQSFSSFRHLSMLLVSWNCDSARPDSLVADPVNVEFLHEALSSVDSPDIIAFGFQEVIDLESRKMTAKNVLLGGKKKPEDNGLSDKVTGAYKRWYDRLTAAVRTAMPASCPYSVIHTENLVGLFTCVFVKNGERAGLGDVTVKTIKRGMGGRYGNKGAIVARFVIGDTSICIINCHLAAGQNAARRRNADAAGILEEKAVFPASDHSLAYVGGGDGSMVLDHEIVLFHGDLNYRIDHRRDAIIAAIRAGDLSALHPHDQLLREIKYNRACRLRGFSEGPLTFAPTYKYDRRSNEYDTSEKHRAPAWCDRILWRSRVPSRVRLQEYRRYEANVSDHRPISGSFEITVKVVDQGERERQKREVERVWVGVEERLLKSAREFYVSQMLL